MQYNSFGIMVVQYDALQGHRSKVLTLVEICIWNTA